ncbi:hypothetical protein NUACC26_001390 [Scytonema sp. NUACC26]
MRALFESVKCDGILMPLLVRPVGDKYELVAGERRYKAYQPSSETGELTQRMEDTCKKITHVKGFG